MVGKFQYSLPAWFDNWLVDLKGRGVICKQEVDDVLTYIKLLKDEKRNDINKLKNKLVQVNEKKNSEIEQLQRKLQNYKMGHSNVKFVKALRDKEKARAEKAEREIQRLQNLKNAAPEIVEKIKKIYIENEGMEQLRESEAAAYNDATMAREELINLQKVHIATISNMGKEKLTLQQQVNTLKGIQVKASQHVSRIETKHRDYKTLKNNELREMENKIESFRQGTVVSRIFNYFKS